jgi:hypothetical protein
MRKLAIVLFMTLATAALSGQTASTSNVAPRTFSPTSALVDYEARVATSDLPTFVMSRSPHAPGERDLDVEVGGLVLKGGNTTVRVAWLPILAPFPGSVPTTTSVMPDAFSLLRTELPWRKGLRPRNVAP